MQIININEIHEIATERAKEAVREAVTNYREKNPDCPYGEPAYPCGFAWVVFHVDGRSKIGKEIKKFGIAKKSHSGAWLDRWNPSGYGGQSVDIKFIGAEAYSQTMLEFGISCYPQSRLD